MRWTEEDLKAHQEKQDGRRGTNAADTGIGQGTGKKAAKYKNEKTMIDGELFDSKREANRWCELRLMEKAGAISHLKRQHPFELAPAVILDGRKKPALKYTCDFTYFDKDNVRVVEDTKSEFLRGEVAFRIRRHLLKSVHGIDITFS